MTQNFDDDRPLSEIYSDLSGYSDVYYEQHPQEKPKPIVWPIIRMILIFDIIFYTIRLIFGP
jgi:hypothetical protein